MSESDRKLPLEHVAGITASYVSNNPVPASDLPDLIIAVHRSVARLTVPKPPEAEVHVPAVSVKASIKPDHLVCLVCGAKLKTLKRHLMAQHGLTPQQYRQRYKLRPDYPIVAPSYSKDRSAMARQFGLGRKARRAKQAGRRSE